MSEFVFLWSSSVFSKIFCKRRFIAVSVILRTGVSQNTTVYKPKKMCLCFFFRLRLLIGDYTTNKLRPNWKKHIKRVRNKNREEKNKTNVWNIWSYMVTTNTQQSTSSKTNSNKFYGLTLFFGTWKKNHHVQINAATADDDGDDDDSAECWTVLRIRDKNCANKENQNMNDKEKDRSNNTHRSTHSPNT